MNQESEKIEPSDAKASFAGNRIVRRLVLLPFVAVVAMFFLSFTSSKPQNLGVRNGQLAECPESPNCVSTQTDRESHQMSPVSFSGTRTDAIGKIKSVVAAEFPRSRLVSETDDYLHFEFKSLIFRFVDDVEFLVNDEGSTIHFRSASRAGHSDLGVNRKRMNLISEKLKL